MKVPEWWVTNLSEIDKLAHAVQHHSNVDRATPKSVSLSI